VNPPRRMNINDNVWVRLTPRGRDIDRAAHEKLRVFAPIVGPDLPFATEISLVDPNAGSNGEGKQP